MTKHYCMKDKKKYKLDELMQKCLSCKVPRMCKTANTYSIRPLQAFQKVMMEKVNALKTKSIQDNSE